jgi:tRNA-specific 2-thiouridylase
VTVASLAPDVALPITCDVAVRYRGRPERAHVQRLGDAGIEIRFAEPVHAVVPGQVAVLYQGERVLGGGTIDSAIAEARPGALSLGAPA